LLLFFAFTGLDSIAQARLGHTRTDIFETFKEYNPTFEIKEDGSRLIHFKMDRALVFQYLNENDICNMSVIVPIDQGDLNFFVEMYNRQYVIVDERNWKMYAENGEIASIELVHHDDLTFFVWK
jgi:hypothetical protein